MSDYAVTGKKGTGKTKGVVIRIREALEQGRRVATNLDLKLEHLLPPSSRATVIRLPDKPTVDDLKAIGIGNESYDEDRNGLLVLDEMGTWFNSRDFTDKDRKPLLDWLVHARKYGWDVYYLMQHVNQVDKQLREALIEYTVRCVKMDKVPLPVIGPFIRLITGGYLNPKLPRFHMCNVRLGVDPNALLVDRWIYRADDIHKAYDTRQVFTRDYPHGIHSALSAWHLRGRYAQARSTWLQAVAGWWCDLGSRSHKRSQPSPRLAPLMALPPDLRWQAARRLVSRGLL